MRKQCVPGLSSGGRGLGTRLQLGPEMMATLLCVCVCVCVYMCVEGALEDHQLGPEMMATMFFCMIVNTFTLMLDMNIRNCG